MMAYCRMYWALNSYLYILFFFTLRIWLLRMQLSISLHWLINYCITYWSILSYITFQSWKKAWIVIVQTILNRTYDPPPISAVTLGLLKSTAFSVWQPTFKSIIIIISRFTQYDWFCELLLLANTNSYCNLRMCC